MADGTSTPEPTPEETPGASRREVVRRVLGTVLVIAVIVVLVVLDRRQPDSETTGTDTPAATDAPSAPTGTTLPLPERGRGEGRKKDGRKKPGKAQPGGPRDISIPAPPKGIEALVCQELSKPVGLTVMSFNIQHGDAGIDRIAAAITRADADIVLMQEVGQIGGGLDQAGQVAQRLDMEWTYGPAVSRGRGVFGNAILSRYEILDSSNTRLPYARGTIARALLRATIELAGRPVNVYSTHLHYGPNPIQVTQASAVSRILAADPLPRLVGGDMNAHPGSRAMSALLGPVSDPWPSVGSGPSGTGPRGGRIDYVLPSPELVGRSSTVLATGASDHRAVRTGLQLPADDCSGS